VSAVWVAGAAGAELEPRPAAGAGFPTAVTPWWARGLLGPLGLSLRDLMVVGLVALG